MANFFKSIGKGVGYFFLFPLLIVGIALYSVFGLLVFIFQFFKLIFLFFTGRTLFSDLKEDVELKALLSKEKEQAEETPAEEEKKEENPMSLYPSDSIVYGSGYSSPLVEEKKEVEQKPEPEPQPQIEVEPDEIIDNNEEGGDY